MMLKLNRSKQRGISLLEVLLSLSVIAVILVMATRYYQTAQQSQQVSNAVSIISGIITAETQYKAANNNQAVNLTTLTSNGYLPNNISNDPWGGAITVTPNGGQYTITSSASIPTNACTMLNNMVKNNTVNNANACTGNTLNATFQ